MNDTTREDIQEYYNQTADGYLLSTVWLKPSEAEKMPWLTTIKPKERESIPYTEFSEIEVLNNYKSWAKENIKNKILANNYKEITVDNITIDADKQSQENVSKKLNEMSIAKQNNIPVPSNDLIWKDKNNVIQNFNSLDAYIQWLSNVVISLSSRNTNLYKEYWDKKEQIDQATSSSEIDTIFNSY